MGEGKLTKQRIMYVCEVCQYESPEGCGHFDREDIAVTSDGRWLCEQCYDDLPIRDRGKAFARMPHPPEYRPAKRALTKGPSNG